MGWLLWYCVLEYRVAVFLVYCSGVGLVLVTMGYGYGVCSSGLINSLLIISLDWPISSPGEHIITGRLTLKLGVDGSNGTVNCTSSWARSDCLSARGRAGWPA